MRKISCGDCRRSWIGALVVAGLVALLTAGCGSTSTLVKQSDKLEAPEGLLVAFNQYWTARAKRDGQASFEREAPYVREMVSSELYGFYLKAMTGKAELRDVEILDVGCAQPNYCCVNCRMVYVNGSKRKVRYLRDCWVKAAGAWGHVIINPLIFPQLGLGDAGRGPGIEG